LDQDSRCQIPIPTSLPFDGTSSLFNQFLTVIDVVSSTGTKALAMMMSPRSRTWFYLSSKPWKRPQASAPIVLLLGLLACLETTGRESCQVLASIPAVAPVLLQTRFTTSVSSWKGEEQSRNSSIVDASRLKEGKAGSLDSASPATDLVEVHKETPQALVPPLAPNAAADNNDDADADDDVQSPPRPPPPPPPPPPSSDARQGQVEESSRSADGRRGRARTQEAVEALAALSAEADAHAEEERGASSSKSTGASAGGLNTRKELPFGDILDTTTFSAPVDVAATYEDTDDSNDDELPGPVRIQAMELRLHNVTLADLHSRTHESVVEFLVLLQSELDLFFQRGSTETMVAVVDLFERRRVHQDPNLLQPFMVLSAEPDAGEIVVRLQGRMHYRETSTVAAALAKYLAIPEESASPESNDSRSGERRVTGNSDEEIEGEDLRTSAFNFALRNISVVPGIKEVQWPSARFRHGGMEAGNLMQTLGWPIAISASITGILLWIAAW